MLRCLISYHCSALIFPPYNGSPPTSEPVPIQFGVPEAGGFFFNIFIDELLN